MKLYNYNMELLAELHNVNPKVTKVLGGISTLSFTIDKYFFNKQTGKLVMDQRFDYVQNETIVEYDNDFYVIKECTPFHETNITKEVNCKHIAIELSGTKVNGLWGFSPSIESFQLPYNEPTDLITGMQDLLHYHTTGWKLGLIPENNKRRSFSYEWYTPMQIILDLAEKFEYIPYFRVELVNGKLNKYVDLLPDDYGEIKAYYRHEKNLNSVRKPISTEGITTRLYVFGYDDITLNDLETENKTVNGVTYPIHSKGKSYIDNFDYYLQLGYSYADCINKFLKVDKVKDDLYDDVNDLYDFAKKQLESVAMPVISYEVSIKDIEIKGKPELAVGHKIRIVDTELGLDVVGRVTEISYSENDKINKSVTISNYYTFSGETNVLTNVIIDQSNLDQVAVQKNKKFAHSVIFNDSTGMIVQKDVSDPNSDDPEYKDVVRIGQYERDKYGIQILDGQLQMDREDAKTRVLIDNETGICIYNDLNGNGVFSEDEKVFWADTEGKIQAKRINVEESDWVLKDGSNLESRIEDHEGRIQSSEIKLEPDNIRLTVGQWFVEQDEYNEKVSGLESSITQTVTDVEFKFTQKGAYNYIQNSDFRNGYEYWSDNGGGIEVANGVGAFSGETMCITSFPSGIQYTDWILLSANTHYIYEGWIASMNGCSGSSITPLHFWCNTEKTNGNTMCEILDYRQECIAGEWTKVYVHIKTKASNSAIYFKPFIYASNATGKVYVKYLSLSKAINESQWTPHPSEIYDGITKIDRDGISISTSNSKTVTRIDHAGMEIQAGNKTLAVFRENSYIPTVTADDVVCSNLVRKHPYSNNYYVDSKSGSDLYKGLSWQTAFKTVQKALDQLPDMLEHDVRIWIKAGSNIPNFKVLNKVGNGLIIIKFGDSSIVNGGITISGCNGVLLERDTIVRSATVIDGISIYECRHAEVSGICIDGKGSRDRGVYIERCAKVHIANCEIRNTTECAIYNYQSIVSATNNRGAGIYNYVTMGLGSITILPEAGTSTTVCNYSNTLVQRSDGGTGRLFDGGTYSKTGSGGSTPTYNGTSKTQQWNFNNYYSVENLTWNYTNTGSLVQGYCNAWNTGRWQGFLNFNHSNVRSIISGGTNYSGRIYIQRLSSRHGNSSGSKIALYGSDGTTINTTETFSLGEGKWISLSTDVIQKIANGVITSFYVKWDSSDASRYIRFETNAKLEITYTK